MTRHNDLYGLQDCIRVEAETLEVIAEKGNKILPSNPRNRNVSCDGMKKARREVDSAKCAPKIPRIAAGSPRSQRGRRDGQVLWADD